MREIGPTPQNKTETTNESFKDLPVTEKEIWADKVIKEAGKSLSKKENWADGALRDASKLKDDSLEIKDLDTELFTENERLALRDLKKALAEGKIGETDTILEKHQINNHAEKEKIFKEFSLREIAVDAAIEAIARGETKFNNRDGYENFESYLLPQIANNPDFQNIALKKTKEYLDRGDPLPAYDLMIQFIPEEIAEREDFASRSKQLLIRILNNEPFLINNFRMTLFGFGKFIPEETLLEQDMQQTVKQTITRLSKHFQEDKSVLLDILELKETFHIN